MIEVVLSMWELELAAIGGIHRRLGAIESGIEPRYGRGDEDLWGSDIESTAAEMAVAKLLDRYYVPALHVQQKGEGDVGPYEVRSSTLDDGCLILRPRDADDAVFILVTGRAPRFVVRGWLRAREGRRGEWVRESNGRPAAWFVPQSALRPVPDRRAA